MGGRVGVTPNSLLSSISLGSLSVLPNGEQRTVYCWGSQCCLKCAQFVSHLALSFTLAGVLCPPRPKQFTVGVVNAVLSVSAVLGVYGGVISAERMLWEVGLKLGRVKSNRNW